MDKNEQAPPPPPEAPDKQKMDEIRRRRMEKLGGPQIPKPAAPVDGENGKASASYTPVSAPEKTETAPKPQINISKAPPTTAPENPFAKLTNRSPSDTSNTIVREKDRKLKRARAESDAEQVNQGSPASSRPKPASTTEDLLEYENHMLGQMFRITLDPRQELDASNHRLIHLPNLRAELEEEGAPITLTSDRLDSAILEACSTVPNNKSILDYLLPCWKRIIKTIRGLRGYDASKEAILKEAKRLCMSNCIFALEMPELYGREPNYETDFLTPYLLFEAGEDRGICPDFLAEAISRFEEDDTVKSVLTKAVAGLSSKLAQLTMKDNYQAYITALKHLCQFPPLVTAIAEMPLFQMAVTAEGIEKHTILGPFFRISPLQSQVSSQYFASPKSMDKGHIRTAQDGLRMTLQQHQRELLSIINLFVRASPTSRNKTLDWFAYIMNMNHKRRAMRPDPTKLSSDGFLLNVTAVLDGLCEPFMDSTFSKVSKIEVDYFRRKPRVDISDETKLNADDKASDEYYKHESPGSSNFITEVFFLTLASHHYGSEATNGLLKGLEKDIKYLTGKLEEFEKERHKYAHNPAQLAQFEQSLKKYNDVLEKSMQSKYAIEGILLDKPMQTKSLLFMRYVTVWLLRIATASDYTPEKTIKLPLAAEYPDTFRFLPEYILEDIVSNFNFILRFIPEVMISAVGDEIIALCITFLTNSDYIKNPYLKAKLVSLLFHGTWPVYHLKKGVLGDSLNGLKFANDNLLHALMKFYIEVEVTGAHTQFYDKFNIRYEIFQVIKCIWSNDVYKQRLTQESKTNTEFFLKFVNLLLNDATYVLDEALTKFPKIHDLQQELDNASLTPEERSTKEEELQTAEGQAHSYMQLTNETVSMMKLFTNTLSSSFTMPEIVDRVAAMVDYTLDTIVGPKSANLKVRDPKKYAFEPKTLLGEFVDIYLNLGISDNFIIAVARDGRSYKPENFNHAARIIRRFGLRSNEDLAAFEALQKRFALAKEADDQDEGDFGEYPDEFEDPLLATLMQDPVILPRSQVTVDRSTIRSHLLSDPHDPFNRTDLRIEDVIPNTDLKERIQAWKMEKRAAGKSVRDATTAAGGEAGNKMDATEG